MKNFWAISFTIALLISACSISRPTDFPQVAPSIMATNIVTSTSPATTGEKWKVIKAIVTEDKPLQTQNSTNNWVGTVLAEETSFSNNLQIKINMESKGVNGIILTATPTGNPWWQGHKRIEIFYENGNLGVLLRDGSQEEPIYNEQVPFSGSDNLTSGEITVTFDRQARNVKIEHNNKILIQIVLSTVGDFPEGLFPNSHILEVELSSGANSSVKLTKLEFLTPESDLDLASVAIPTPIPTLSLPVSQLTPIPFSSSKINTENVKDLQEVARYYGQANYTAKLTQDQKFLFILDPDGIAKYNYQTMAALTHIPIANSGADLQMSLDGHWLLIDNNWLVDLRSDKEPTIYVLSEKIHLLNQYSTKFSLSFDGTMIAVEQLSCYDSCNYSFQVVSTKDFKVLHASTGITRQELPTFSLDGSYLAVVDSFPKPGLTGYDGAAVIIRNTQDFTKISNFPLHSPFFVRDMKFSENGRLLAVAQTTRIDILDITTGNVEFTISDLCEAWDRKVMFAPTSSVKILESSSCSSGIWKESGQSIIRSQNENPFNLSRVSFDSNGNPKTIPYPYPLTELRSYFRQYDFQFLSNDIIAFKRDDQETHANHSCQISLSNSSLNCQSHNLLSTGQRSVGKDIFIGTDRQYYSFEASPNGIVIYSLADQGQLYYSIQGQKYGFEIGALDPLNKLLFYWTALTDNQQRILVEDMESGKTLTKWEGQTFLSSIAFSENKKIAAICRSIGSGNTRGQLTIFDLVQKKVIFSMNITCGGASMALTQTGNKLAIEYYYLNPKDNQYTIQTIILNLSGAYERKYLDIEATSPAVAFSPDDSLLAVACGNTEICFLDPTDGSEIYRLQAHSNITNLAFSKDGSRLAASSQWGLISVWEIPPFIQQENNGDLQGASQLPVCLPGDKIIDFDSTYTFEVEPVDNVSGYLWQFVQNGTTVWQLNPGEPEATTASTYVIPLDSPAHASFIPGQVEVWVRAYLKSDKWSPFVFISACLEKR